MPTVTFLGNFGAEHSTENEVRKAFVALDWSVVAVEESRAAAEWDTVRAHALASDLVLYVATQGLPTLDLVGLWAECAARGVPTASLHLDLFYGLDSAKGAQGINRRDWPARHPMFRVAYCATADGGSHNEFVRDGVHHRWFPPAVSEWECEPGTPRAEYESDVAFVGSWQGGYHPESGHRDALVKWLDATYGDRCRFWPKRGQPAIRGEALRDLYASTRVVVGDSCLAGTGKRAYYSDRIPETLGRGAFLLHPHVDGVFPEHYVPRAHLDTWEPWEWGQLRAKIDGWLDRPAERAQVAESGRRHVLAHHTYTHRVRDLLAWIGVG